MKNSFYSKLLLVLSIAFTLTLSACSTFEKTEANYASNYDKYLVAQVTCVQHDKNVVSLLDSGGNPITISHAAGNCNDIDDPEHGGAYVAQLGSSAIIASGQVLSSAITAYQSYQNTKDSNETRVAIANLDREIEESRNGVIIQAINGQTETLNSLGDVTTVLAEQNVTLGELLAVLAEVDEEMVDNEAPVDE
jgi:hypothetical protein